MTDTIYDTLRRLVEWAAPPGTDVLSLYLDIGNDEDAVEFARTHCDDLLVDRDAAFVSRVRAELDRLPDRITEARAREHDGLALFVSVDPPLDECVSLRFAFENQALVGRDPFLRHLLTFAEEYERSVCLVVAADRVHVCEIHIGDLIEAHEVSATERRDLADEVTAVMARTLRDEASTHLIMMGEPRLREFIEKKLPHDAQARIIDWIDEAITPDDARFLRVVHRALQAYERRTEAHGVARLLELRDEREEVAIGLEQTVATINKGKVKKLFTLQGYEHRGWLCDACDCLGALPSPPACVACGATVTEVPLEEHIYDQAAACGAEIETVYQSESLSRVGGIGALIDE